MTNLFSIFDPSGSILSMNWLMLIIPIILMSNSSKKSSKLISIMTIISKNINKELNSMMEKSKKKSSSNILFSTFLVIMIINMISLMPFNFTITSQISFNLPAALSIWLSYLILGWTKKCKSMLAHLVPMGTPNALLPIMVLIELISQIIRPITLSVRLTANMVAGHLLMSLLGEFSLNSKMNTILSSPLIMTLTFLEICVSMIQAYVFMTLITLYSTEIN
uniref:ATP synthase subunit a n=1 Tax=Arrenurus rostratus TaxID=3136836 RepID=A0AAU6QDK6_9ACAR